MTTTDNLERRSRASTLVARDRGDGAPPSSPGTLTGHIAVFDSVSEDLGGFVERIAPGAFLDTLARNDVVALFNHNTDSVLGRLSAGTLRLAEDAVGLAFDLDLPDTQAGRDLWTLAKRGDLTGCSFGFAIRDADWSLGPGGAETQTLKSVDLFEVSVGVTFPAYAAPLMEARRSSRARLKARRDAARRRRLARLRLAEAEAARPL